MELTQCTKGGYFGELALVTHKPRAASVYAVGDLVCAGIVLLKTCAQHSVVCALGINYHREPKGRPTIKFRVPISEAM